MTHSRSNRRRKASLFQPEILEERSLMTGGAGSIFALMKGTVGNAGGSAEVTFTIDPSHFTLPQNKLVLGLDVAPDTNSTVTPLITAITGPNGKPVPGAYTTLDETSNESTSSTAGQVSNVVIAPLHIPKGQTEKFTVTVSAQGTTEGDFLLGFYLPGDENGDGTVTKSDISAIRGLKNTTASSSLYNFDADANRNGKIDNADVTLAMQNMGVSTTIEPVVSSNLQAAYGLDAVDRVSNNPDVVFTGQSTPGATITYTNIASPTASPVTTTADASGNYTVDTPLVLGSNTFAVNITDEFGQTISGDISPVTYTTTPVATNPSPTAATTTTTTSTATAATTTTTMTKAQQAAAAKAAKLAAAKAARAADLAATATSTTTTSNG